MESFLTYFCREVSPVKLVEKHESSLMRFVNKILGITNRWGWTNIKSFMDNYVTTIGRTIYCPIGWHMDMPTTPILVHELTHVVQYKRRGWRYCLQYILSSTKRAFYESECVQAEMAVFNLLTTEFVKERAENLMCYGIPKSTALQELKDRALEMYAGKMSESSGEILNAYRSYRRKPT